MIERSLSIRLSRILGTASWSISNEAFKHADWRLLKRFFIKIGNATTKTIFRRQRSRPTWRVPTAHVALKRKSFSWSHCRFLWKIFLTNVNQHVKRLHLRYSTKVCLKFDSTYCTMYNNKSAQRKKKSSLLYMQIVSLNIADKNSLGSETWIARDARRRPMKRSRRPFS